MSRLHLRYRLRIALILRLALLAAIAVALVWQQWQLAFTTTGVLAVSLAPVALRRSFDVRIPMELETCAVVMVFAALFAGEVLDLYQKVWWWDKVLHTTSGFLQGIVGFLLVYVLNESKDVEVHSTPAFVAFFAFCFSMMLGVVWEIFEFAMDSSFGLNMQKSGLVDTMWDLIVNTIGAMAIAIPGYVYLRTIATDSFLERWIESFIEANPRLFQGPAS